MLLDETPQVQLQGSSLFKFNLYAHTLLIKKTVIKKRLEKHLGGNSGQYCIEGGRAACAITTRRNRYSLPCACELRTDRNCEVPGNANLCKRLSANNHVLFGDTPMLATGATVRIAQQQLQATAANQKDLGQSS